MKTKFWSISLLWRTFSLWRHWYAFFARVLIMICIFCSVLIWVIVMSPISPCKFCIITTKYMKNIFIIYLVVIMQILLGVILTTSQLPLSERRVVKKKCISTSCNTRAENTYQWRHNEKVRHDISQIHFVFIYYGNFSLIVWKKNNTC
jgi:hypothetical protein